MARITEEALDEVELRRFQSRAKRERIRPIAPRVARGGSVVSLVLLVGGAGALVAPDRLPGSLELLAIAAVAVGGWLAGRAGSSQGDRGVVDRERAEVIRAALHFGVRGYDVLAEQAGRARRGAPAEQPGEAPGDELAPRRPTVLRRVAEPGSGERESLALDADEGTGP